MTNQEFDEWMRELRSNKYTKLRGALGQDNSCCALGVYLNHCSKNKARFERFKDINKGVLFNSIAIMNDNTDLTLPELADYIESNHRTEFVKD